MTDKGVLSICFISPLPPPRGGIAQWTLLVSRWLHSHPGIRLTHIDIAPRWRDFESLAVWKRALGGGLQLVRDYARFLLAASKGIDVVHLTTSGRLATMRDVVICATARLMRIPVAYHLHFGRVPDIAAAGTLEWRFLKCAMKFAARVLVFDAASAAAISAALPQARIEIVPNPVDIAALPEPGGGSGNRRVAFFLGWVIPEKGIEQLVQAWALSSPRGWDLEIAGPGSPAYQTRLLEKYRPENVRFSGELPHDEAMRRLACCDLFILPSYTEAFPYVVLEAMALGKAIIATRVGAIPMMLAGDCGLLVAPRETAELAAALGRLLPDLALRESFGARAREKAQACYSIDAVMSSILAIWRNMTLQRTHRPEPGVPSER